MLNFYLSLKLTSAYSIFDYLDSVFVKKIRALRVRLWPCKIDLNPPVSFVLQIVPSRYFCGGSFCFMSWCSKYFCAVGALCMFAYF